MVAVGVQVESAERIEAPLRLREQQGFSILFAVVTL